MQSLLAPEALALVGIVFLAALCAFFVLANRLEAGLAERHRDERVRLGRVRELPVKASSARPERAPAAPERATSTTTSS